jgi:hypothetical protein
MFISDENRYGNSDARKKQLFASLYEASFVDDLVTFQPDYNELESRHIIKSVHIFAFYMFSTNKSQNIASFLTAKLQLDSPEKIAAFVNTNLLEYLTIFAAKSDFSYADVLSTLLDIADLGPLLPHLGFTDSNNKKLLEYINMERAPKLAAFINKLQLAGYQFSENELSMIGIFNKHQADTSTQGTTPKPTII